MEPSGTKARATATTPVAARIAAAVLVNATPSAEGAVDATRAMAPSMPGSLATCRQSALRRRISRRSETGSSVYVVFFRIMGCWIRAGSKNKSGDVFSTEIGIDGRRGRMRPRRTGDDEGRGRACAFGFAASHAMIDGGDRRWGADQQPLRRGGRDRIGARLRRRRSVPRRISADGGSRDAASGGRASIGAGGPSSLEPPRVAGDRKREAVYRIFRRVT